MHLPHEKVLQCFIQRLENLRKKNFLCLLFPTSLSRSCGRLRLTDSHRSLHLWRVVMMSFIYSNYLVVAKSSFNLEPHVSLMSFANICKCVMVCTYCMCLDLYVLLWWYRDGCDQRGRFRMSFTYTHAYQSHAPQQCC